MSRRRQVKWVGPLPHQEDEIGWDPDWVPELEPVRVTGPSWASWWDDAWAAETLAVVDRVWRKEGFRFYYGGNRALQLDDLRSWLVAEAMEFRERFKPPVTGDIAEAWFAILHANLRQLAQNHFTQVARGFQMDSPSTSLDWHAEVGSHPRMAGLGHLEELEPPRYLILLENLAAAHDPRDGAPKDPSLCQAWGCQATVHAKRLCASHYDAARHLDADPCSVPGCDGWVHARGLCNTHYRAEVAAARPDCLEPGCEKKQAARGLCSTHRDQYAKAGRDYPLASRVSTEVADCSVDDCTKPAKAKGMCAQHHKRAWRQQQRDAA